MKVSKAAYGRYWWTYVVRSIEEYLSDCQKCSVSNGQDEAAYEVQLA